MCLYELLRIYKGNIKIYYDDKSLFIDDAYFVADILSLYEHDSDIIYDRQIDYCKCLFNGYRPYLKVVLK